MAGGVSERAALAFERRMARMFGEGKEGVLSVAVSVNTASTDATLGQIAEYLGGIQSERNWIVAAPSPSPILCVGAHRFPELVAEYVAANSGLMAPKIRKAWYRQRGLDAPEPPPEAPPLLDGTCGDQSEGG